MSDAQALRARGLDALVFGVYLLLAGAHWSVAEDAYISFRYARNLVDGFGLRFNPGESPPVEGFSNLLLVVLAAVFEAVGLSPEVGVPVVTIGCGGGVLLLVLRLARRTLGVGPGPSRWAVLALAVLPPFTVWATSGLEPMPQTLAFLGAAAGLAFADRAREQWLAGLAGLALALLRTEGIAWTPVFVALAVVVRQAEGRRLAPALVRYLAVVMPGAALWLAWKVSYFGELLSNVAHAKMGVGPVVLQRGLSYVTTFALVEVWPVLALVAAALVAPRVRVAWAAALGLGVLGWAALVGGDYMAWFRFLVPSLPLFALVLAAALDAAFARAPRPAVAHGLAAVVALVGFLPDRDVILVPQAVLRPLDYSTPNHAEGDVRFTRGLFHIPGTVRFLEWEARALGEFAKPGSKVVTAAIGLNGYRNPRLVLLDLCGLVSPAVARREVEVSPDKRPGHEKCVGPAFFEGKDPDVLVFGAANGRKGLDELREKATQWRRKHPAKKYAPDFVMLPADVPGGWIFGYGLRRVPEGRNADALWRSYFQRLDELEERGPPVAEGA